MLPFLVYLCKMDSIKARATTCFCLIPQVLIASFFYNQNSYIDYKRIVPIVVGGVRGGIIGAKLLKKIPKKILQISFICFVIFVSIRMIL